MNLQKYKWKNRILLIDINNYQNKKYKEVKEIYQENIKEFHKRYIKLISNLNKNNDFKIKLIGFDGNIKLELNKLNPKKIFNKVDKMPLAKLLESNKKLKPKNLSLYSDYDKSTTLTGLGFKNKEKAIYTLDAIKNKPIKYQISLVNTMIGRAKNHPHQTNEMLEAIKVFQEWVKNYKKNKK